MKRQEYIKHIFFKYVEGEYSNDDLDFLLSELASNDSKREEFENLIEEALDNAHGLEKLQPEINRIGESTMQSLRQMIKPRATRPIRLFLKIAASILAISSLSVAVYHLTSDTKVGQTSRGNMISTSGDISPGRNRAIISVGNQPDMVLDDGESGIEISDNEIRYADGPALTQLKPTDMIQVRTPHGGQFEVALSDGTRVWLNAGSTLRYPAEFGTKERRVTLVGEAYFEVSKELGRSRRAFVVASNMQDIKVLGTHFNVNAYPDEVVTTTTLIEGAVSVTAKGSGKRLASEVLKPGQQSVLRKGVLQVKAADIEQALAWKNNMFIFNNMPLEEVMKTIARWYDVDVYYQNKSAVSDVYAGSITRYENLSKVLRMLEKAGDTRFKLEEGRVVVMK